MKNRKVFLILVLLLTFVVRLYGFSNPLADWHSWRQSDTSAVSRSFVQNGFDLLHPTFEDLSNVPSGLDNPHGYRFVEFPIYNFLQAGGYLLFRIFTLEEWGRLVTITSSIFTTLFLYLMVKRHIDECAAFFVGFFYAVMPFSIYYGRVVLPDPLTVMAILGGIFFFDLWIEKSEKFNPSDSLRTRVESSKSQFKAKSHFYYLLALIFTAAAFLLKPYALFFTLPMIVLAWKRYGWRMFAKRQLWLFACITLVPIILWRVWMMQYPEGIPASMWLFNGGNIRFKGAFFYWLFADRFCRLILGYWGVALFVFGLLFTSHKTHFRKYGLFFYSFIVSSLVYLTVIARGNVQHDYYQILIIPSVALFMGLGARALFLAPKEYMSPFFSRVVLLVCIAFMLGFGWFYVRDYFNINNPAILTAGKAVQILTPATAKVVAPYDGDTTLLYYTNRQGWASFQNPLPELIAKGATHLLLLSPSEKDLDIGREYKIIANTKDYLLFDLINK